MLRLFQQLGNQEPALKLVGSRRNGRNVLECLVGNPSESTCLVSTESNCRASLGDWNISPFKSQKFDYYCSLEVFISDTMHRDELLPKVCSKACVLIVYNPPLNLDHLAKSSTQNWCNLDYMALILGCAFERRQCE